MAIAPKVSVLIPVYNGERHLTECLESVLAQDYNDLEILIVDDGSSDGSQKIIEQFAARDPRIRWWKNFHNLGQTQNHNLCLREARGEFIKFVHQDDKLLSTAAIRKLVAALTEHPAATLAASASDVIDDRARLKCHRDFFKTGVWDGRHAIQASLEAVANSIGEPTVVMFRKAQAARGFLDDYQQLWDLEMWYHLLEQGNFIYLAEPLCAFRQHAAQQTNTNARNGIGPNDVWMLLETYHAKPWLHTILTQRMLINHARFLKQSRSKIGSQADLLLARIKPQINPASYPLYWLERKWRHQATKIKKLQARWRQNQRD